MWQITGLPLNELASMVGRQLPVLSLIVPFWLVAALAGWRGMIGVWPACFVTGLTFSAVQFLISNLHGPWLTAPASALAALGALLLLLRFWQPAQPWHFPEDTGGNSSESTARSRLPIGVLFRAWLPWILLTATVAIWALPWTKAALNSLWQPSFVIPYLHGAVHKAPPLAQDLRAEPAIYVLNILSATGTAPLLAGLLGGTLLGLGPLRLLATYVNRPAAARLH